MNQSSKFNQTTEPVAPNMSGSSGQKPQERNNLATKLNGECVVELLLVMITMTRESYRAQVSTQEMTPLCS